MQKKCQFQPAVELNKALAVYVEDGNGNCRKKLSNGWCRYSSVSCAAVLNGMLGSIPRDLRE